ncbi:stage II sporulation protein M [Candidatus Woesearchaeota archaeon]|nr:stage II sporulation protein M [Candidatus Woesearchaeota archaeon]
MVLELLINPKKAEKTPWEMFFLGLVYASVAMLLSMWIFEDNISMVMVFLTVLSCTYLIQGTFRLEEKKDENLKKEISRLKEHAKALSFLMFLFLGFTLAFSLGYVFMPAESLNKVYGVQMTTIESINSPGTTGNSTAATGLFTKILFNNLKVLFFSFLFAFFYGAGAIFILAWNASVVGTAIGSFTRNGLANVANTLGLTSIGSYLSSYSLGLLRYLTHGWLEILAYFTAALAGGIISISMLKHDIRSPEFGKTLVDFANLAAISVIMLVIAAAVEVYVTPVFF